MAGCSCPESALRTRALRLEGVAGASTGSVGDAESRGGQGDGVRLLVRAGDAGGWGVWECGGAGDGVTAGGTSWSSRLTSSRSRPSSSMRPSVSGGALASRRIASGSSSAVGVSTALTDSSISLSLRSCGNEDHWEKGGHSRPGLRGGGGGYDGLRGKGSV